MPPRTLPSRLLQTRDWFMQSMLVACIVTGCGSIVHFDPLEITPGTPLLAPRALQTFIAVGGSGKGLAWSLTTNNSGGGIDTAGVYQAGATANPECSLSNAGAPGDSKLTEETSERCAKLFVVHGCMSRLRWQLPASCDQYHRSRDRLPISQDRRLAGLCGGKQRAGQRTPPEPLRTRSDTARSGDAAFG